MVIWTTPELKTLVEDGLPLKICDREDIRFEFLKKAALNDGALLPLEEGYLEFLARVKANGVVGPVVFISNENAQVSEELYSYNAIHINIKGLDTAWVRKLLRFLFRTAACRGIPDIKVNLPKFEAPPKADRPIINSTRIHDVISYVIQEGLSIIISFEITEEDRVVTVRGVCKLSKENGTLKLYNFRPSLILKGLKEGTVIKAVLPFKDTSYETNMTIRHILDREVEVSVPEFLLIERRRYVRVTPSPRKPVRVFILIPSEQTLSAEVIDISQRGIGFVTSRELMVNDVYAFAIQLPENENIILSYGVIRYRGQVSNGYRYGVELQIHPRDEDIIAQYITKREIEIIDLLKKL